MAKAKSKNEAKTTDLIEETVAAIVEQYGPEIEDTEATDDSRKAAFDAAAKAIDSTVRVVGDSAVAILRQKLKS